MKQKTLLALSLAVCCSGILSAAVLTANAEQELGYNQVELLQGLSTDNISVTDLEGNAVFLAAGPHGGSGDKSVLVDGVIKSTQTTKLVDADGKGVVGYVTIDAGAEYVVNKLLVDIVHDWGAKDFSIELSTTADFSDAVVIYSNKTGASFTADADIAVSSVLMNVKGAGLTFEFSPVKARYVRITGNTYGSAMVQGYTCLGEVQMWAVKDTLDVYANLPGGSYKGEQEIVLDSTAEDTEIYYTLDGSVPTTSSLKYEEPITVVGEKNIRAVAYADGTYGYPFDFNYFASSENDYEIGANYCLNKTVTAYDTSGNELNAANHNGGGTSLSAVVDGTMGTANSIQLATADGTVKNTVGWIEVDMGQSVWINKVNLTLWNNWSFRSITIQVSDDSTFTTGVTTILCTDYKSWHVDKSLAGSLDPDFDWDGATEWVKHSGDGWELNFEAVKGRYIRTLNQAGQGQYATVLTELQAWTCAAPTTESDYEYKDFVTAVDYTDTLEVYCGKAFADLELPEVLVTYSDGSERTLAVTWDETAYNSSVAGTYVITGTATDELDVYGLLSDITVNVTVKELDLAVKAQTNSAKDTIRFVSAVDSLDYAKVGFELSVEINGTVKTVTVETTSVYTALLANGTKFYSTAFGVENGYLFAYSVSGVPSADTQFTVRAYVVTNDGETFYGEANVLKISDANA